MTKPGQPTDRFRPAAALAAALFPGAGHALLGHTRRAVLVGASILALFFGGFLIGGISVVDRKDNPIWFIAQALNGPIAFGADYIHQHRFKVVDKQSNPRASFHAPRTADPDEMIGPSGSLVRVPPGSPLKPPYVKSVGRINEIGVLYVALAGMLNLIAILDAAFNKPREKEDPAIAAARRLMQTPQPGSAASPSTS